MDMDRDGDLDLLGQGGLNKKKNNFIFRNLGGAYFRLLSSPIGSETFFPFAYGYLVTDFDMDGYLDIFLYGDHIELWKGRSNLRFTNVTEQVLPSSYPMKFFSTAAQIDIDNDGDFDVYLTGGQRLKGGGVPGKDLLLENRNGTFVDISLTAQLPRRGGRIGVGVADFDNDGFQDLFLGSAISQPANFNASRMVDIILRNNGDNTFTQYINHGATEANLLDDMTFPAGLQPFDYDRDGRVDVIVSTRLNYNKFDGPGTSGGALFGKLQLFKNIVNNSNNWFTVKVPVNVQGRTTMDALLKLRTPTGLQYRRVGSVGEGRAHSFIDQVHFGIGLNTQVEEVVLETIGGFVQITNNLVGVPVNQIYTLVG
uniref:ASPIC/UnbV domain-containing protein n=1 Tax=Compsopogon caeruleus TaxID=31354 RepID=A0A7S1XF33_9RHOD